MIKLKWLKMKGFRSFVEENVIVFPLNGLVLVNGTNASTKDSSGTGKSSIFYAIAYALDILPPGFTAKDLQSLYTEEKMQVELCLEIKPNIDLIIGRGKETYCEYNGTKLQGSKLVNQKITEIVGLSPEMLYHMAFRPQDTSGLFLNKTDSEKREFLVNLLGLSKIENAIELSEELLKVAEKEFQDLAVRRKFLTEEQAKIILGTADEARNQIDALTIKLSEKQKEIVLAEAEIVHRTARLEALKEELSKNHKDTRALAKQFILKLKSEDERSKALIERENKLKDFRLRDIEKQIESFVKASQSLKTIEAQLVDLYDLKCPTCHRPSNDKTLVEQLELAKDALLSELEFNKHCYEEKKELVNSFDVFTENKKIRELEQVISNSIAEESAQFERAGKESYKELALLHNKQVNLERELAPLTEALLKQRQIVSSYDERKSLIYTRGVEIQTIDSKMNELSKTIHYEKVFIESVGKTGFLGRIFDEVLNELVSEINRLLSVVANMSGIQFSFNTEKLQVDGQVKKVITPVILMGGHECKVNLLSGGMFSSLNLITDLAIKNVLERRTGIAVGFQFTDEAFNGQGQPTKEACLEILKAQSIDRTFFVIDHDCQFQELFDSVINVQMVNGKSNIT